MMGSADLGIGVIIGPVEAEDENYQKKEEENKGRKEKEENGIAVLLAATKKAHYAHITEIQILIPPKNSQPYPCLLTSPDSSRGNPKFRRTAETPVVP
jgi:hypothetical protein